MQIITFDDLGRIIAETCGVPNISDKYAAAIVAVVNKIAFEKRHPVKPTLSEFARKIQKKKLEAAFLMLSKFVSKEIINTKLDIESYPDFDYLQYKITTLTRLQEALDASNGLFVMGLTKEVGQHNSASYPPGTVAILAGIFEKAFETEETKVTKTQLYIVIHKCLEKANIHVSIDTIRKAVAKGSTPVRG